MVLQPLPMLRQTPGGKPIGEEFLETECARAATIEAHLSFRLSAMITAGGDYNNLAGSVWILDFPADAASVRKFQAALTEWMGAYTKAERAAAAVAD